jgi:hypothetical protein
MSPREYMQKHTHKEHLTWLAYLEQQMNEPNRTDHYLMQLTVELVRFMSLVVSHKNSDVTMDKVRLRFSREEPTRQLSEEEINLKRERSRSFWLSGLTTIQQKRGSKHPGIVVPRPTIGKDGKVRHGQENKTEGTKKVSPRVRPDSKPGDSG